MYHLKKRGKKWLIIRDEDKIIVGKSDYKARALRSIGYRMEAIAKKEGLKAKKITKVL